MFHIHIVSHHSDRHGHQTGRETADAIREGARAVSRERGRERRMKVKAGSCFSLLRSRAARAAGRAGSR